MESLCRFGPEIPNRGAESLSESPDIVLCSLQTVQEGEESVAGFVATRRSIRRGWLGECFLLHGKCRFEINLCRFNMFVTQPQGDHRTVDACLQKIHGHGVPQAVHSYTFVFQRRVIPVFLRGEDLEILCGALRDDIAAEGSLQQFELL